MRAREERRQPSGYKNVLLVSPHGLHDDPGGLIGFRDWDEAGKSCQRLLSEAGIHRKRMHRG